MTTSAPTLSVQRELFEIPNGISYLNCASAAPQLRAVEAAGLASVRRRRQPWTLSTGPWFSGVERLRELFGHIIGADANGIAIGPSVSYGIAVAAANIPVERDQSILVLDREFPSNVYAWRELARTRGGRVRTVAPQEGSTWTDAVLVAIDCDTAVVAVPNCHWTDGRLIDLVRVGTAARSVGAALVVDASQSISAYPTNISAIHPDFLVTVGHKWLLGL